MSVVAPPRPAEPALEPVDPFEPEALIEEARDRARRRRRRRAGAILALAGVAGLLGLALVWHGDPVKTGAAGGRTAPSTASRLPDGIIALTGIGRSVPHVLLWTPQGVRDSGIRGMAFGWSPDGKRLLVQRDSALLAVHVKTRHEVLLTRAGSGFNAAWSPDGSLVAFEGGRAGPVTSDSLGWRKIVVVGADGRGAHVLPGWALDGGFFTGNLHWSRDGRDIIFAGRTAGNPTHRLYAVAAHGRSAPRPLPVPAAADPAQPTFSPDGSLLAFTDSGSGSIGDLVIVRSDGSDPRRIEGGTGLVWSPDGTMLAYRTHGDSSLWTVHADGTHRRRLPPASWAGLSWSPDSRTIAYAGGSGHSANGDVYIVHPDGTGRRRIIHAPGGGYGLPLWRDGSSTTEAG